PEASRLCQATRMLGQNQYIMAAHPEAAQFLHLNQRELGMRIEQTQHTQALYSDHWAPLTELLKQLVPAELTRFEQALPDRRQIRVLSMEDGRAYSSDNLRKKLLRQLQMPIHLETTFTKI